MKRKLTAALLSVLMMISMLAIGSISASAAPVSDTINSVVVVSVCFQSENENNETFKLGHGSGFFVGNQGEAPTYLITNHHVIREYTEGYKGDRITCTIKNVQHVGRMSIRVFFDSNDWVEAYPVEYDAKADYAVLRLASPTTKRTPLPVCKPTSDMRGSTVYAVGFPGLSDEVWAEPTSKWGLDDSSVTRGGFGRLFTQSGTGTENIQLDCEIKHGNSGGPLVNENGAVLGITTWGTPEGYTEELKYAVSISNVIPVLQKNSIPFELIDATGLSVNGNNNNNNNNNNNDNNNDNNNNNNNNNNNYNNNNNDNNNVVQQTEPVTTVDISQAISDATAAQNATENATQATEPVTQDNGANTIIIVLIVIIALLLVGGGAAVIVVMMNKNKKEAAKAADEAKAMAAAAAAQAATKTPYVRSMAAQHGNARIKMTPGMEIMMGRSHDCKIVYKEGTVGVSSRHCTLTYDAASKSFVLRDLKSTFGTFLQDGTRLTPNASYRLRSGDRFYLGDKSNMICVELE